MTRFAVGVDGGGTRTRAVVVDEAGEELARGEGRGAVVTAAHPEAAASAVNEAVGRALAEGGLRGPAAVLWAGLSGAGRPDARAAATDALTRAGIADRVVVGTDVEAAFHDAFGGGDGVLLIAGTGSIALARGPRGDLVRVGGWGAELGDEGGGYRIGLEALRAVVRADDGRDPPAALRASVLEHLGLADAQELVGWIAAAPKSEVAALVPLVTAAAADGDEAARAILDRAIDELAAHVRAILGRSGPWPEPPALALWGGLIFEGGPLRAALLAAVAHHPVRLLERALDPTRGAVGLALEVLAGA